MGDLDATLESTPPTLERGDVGAGNTDLPPYSDTPIGAKGSGSGRGNPPRSPILKTSFHRYTIVDRKTHEEEDYRLILIPKALRNGSNLTGRAGDKLYVVLKVPKLDWRGNIRRKKDGSMITREKSIMTQWEFKVADGTFNDGTVAFNSTITQQYRREFNAVYHDVENGSVKVSLRLDKSIKFFDSIWYGIICQHPDKNVNVAMLFLYLSLIPSTFFFLLGLGAEVLRVDDFIRAAIGWK